MKVELLSDAVNKPLGLMVIVLVGIFIIKMRGKIKTYGMPRGNGMSGGNRGFATNNINIANNNGNNNRGNNNRGNNNRGNNNRGNNNGNNRGNNNRGNNRGNNNGNNRGNNRGNNSTRRTIGNIGRTALAIGDFYIAIQFALFVFFISLFIFLASAIEKGQAGGARKERLDRIERMRKDLLNHSDTQRRNGDIAFWLTALLIGASVTGAGKGRYFWPTWLILGVQDLIRRNVGGDNKMSVVNLFMIINIFLIMAVPFYYSWSTFGIGSAMFLISLILSSFVAHVVAETTGKIGKKRTTRRVIKRTTKKAIKQVPKTNPSDRTWPSFGGRGGQA